MMRFPSAAVCFFAAISAGALAQTPAPQPGQNVDVVIEKGDTIDTSGRFFLGPVRPGINFGAPTAFGRDWGQAAAGFVLQDRTRDHAAADGAGGLSIGFGDRRSLALDLGINIRSTGFHDPVASHGSLSFKIHRALPGDAAVAAGVQNTLKWGFSDLESSPYAVVSKMVRLKQDSGDSFSRLFVSVGVGGGRFRLSSGDAAGVFAGVAVKANDRLNLFTEWSGNDLNAGFSFVPFRSFPVILTPAFVDLTRRVGRGARFNLAVALPFHF